MRVSVVIPALNEEEFIESCLRALRAQTVPAEIIVVDNGSNDRTVEIARRYADKVIEAPGVRITALRQIGAEATSGEIIATTDADTMTPPKWIESLIVHFKDPSVVAVGGPIRVLKDGLMKELYALGISTFARAGLLLGANMAFRRDALLRAGGYARVRRAEDWNLANRLRRYGKVVFEPEAYVFTDVPINREIEFAAIAANAGLLGVGVATRSPLPIGLSTGFFLAELGSTIDTAQDDLHHSQIAAMGLALLGVFYGAIPPSAARFVAGFLTGILSQHWIKEDIRKPTWFHTNGALLTGITLLLVAA